jgi:hypothetical protein
MQKSDIIAMITRKGQSLRLRSCHRDYWYAVHAKGHAPAAPGDYLNLDRKLYQKLYDLLGGSDGMLHFRDHDYGSLYPRRHEEKLVEFVYYARMPETEFFDAQMASAFADLRSAIIDHKKADGNRVWYEPNDEAGISQEWLDGEHPQEKRFWESVEVMNKAAMAIWETFCQFVKTARASLKVEQ